MLVEKQERLAAAFLAATSPADSVDVIIRVIWGVELDNPVNFGKVEAPLRDIRAQQNTSLGLAELKVGGGPFLLFLLAVDVLNRNVYIVEQV